MAKKSREKAVAFDRARVPGPRESQIQVRDAGVAATRDDQQDWDDVDEAADETFPASDATAKY
ncbi:MAG TPA: hypothetical protein VNS12_13045 [Pelagibacterium sp.]|uniref:hypothetical protein n=1 Tax=Pelagibacterium sp. TaxID=1967288 RepID=UPI002CEFE47D|nr:hypothetical protein [Pelagibacterium sp.]HWJ88989.1 hypothetical protein [Pelagibacterium sp.]